MATLSPTIHTYHCICNSLLLASTHTLSTLPRRQGSALDEALILPLPPAPLARAISDSPEPRGESAAEKDGSRKESKDLPAEGYTLVLGMVQDKKVTIIRREDGFERRVLSRCSRCNVVVGYEIQGDGTAMDIDTKEKEAEWYTGKVMYLIPGGVMSTEVMMSEKKLREEDVDIRKGSVTVFE